MTSVVYRFFIQDRSNVPLGWRRLKSNDTPKWFDSGRLSLFQVDVEDDGCFVHYFKARSSGWVLMDQVYFIQTAELRGASKLNPPKEIKLGRSRMVYQWVLVL